MPPSANQSKQQRLMDNKETIKEVLRTFKIEVEDISMTRGSTVTLYSLRPVMGTRISRIRNLKDELAVALSVPAVRVIAPMQDGSVGIEVPNERREIVKAEDILSSAEYRDTDMKLPCAIGETIDGQLFMRDLADMPHLLIAGATGQGKSVCLNMLLMSMMNRRSPKEMQIMLIDPKQVELSVYATLYGSYLAASIATTTEDAINLLERVVELMESRYTLLSAKGVRNIAEYNKGLEEGEEFMRYCVVVVDEYADLRMTTGKMAESMICRIAQKARAVGIHMIIATQRPSATIVTGNIKANFPVRIAFRVASGVDSRVILDHTGAEDLSGKGDMLYSDGLDDVRVQCGFGDTKFVRDNIRKLELIHPETVKSVLDIEEPEKKRKEPMEISKNLEDLMCYFALHRERVRVCDFGILWPYIFSGNMAMRNFDKMVEIGCLGEPVGEGFDRSAEVLVCTTWMVRALCADARGDEPDPYRYISKK